MRKKRLWCLSWRIHLDFFKRGTIDSSSSSISAATEVFCESQEYKTPHMVNQHQVCFLYFDNERAGFRTHYGVSLGYHKIRLYYPQPRAAEGAYLTVLVLSKASAGRAPGLGLIMVFH